MAATTILVSALLVDGDRALMVRAANGDWDLPSGPLEDEESTEEALRRLLLARWGILPTDEEFLDTYYEQSAIADGPSIRNVYLVRSWTGGAPGGASGQTQQRWVHPRRLGDIQLSASLLSALHDGFQFLPHASHAAWIVVLAGSPSNGSAVATALCRHRERTAYVDVDVVRRMVISGGASQSLEASDAPGRQELAELAAANVTALARNFVASSLNVVVGLDAETVAEITPYLESLHAIAPIRVVTLDASARASIGQDLSLDSSRLTADEMASVIVAHLDSAAMD